MDDSKKEGPILNFGRFRFDQTGSFSWLLKLSAVYFFVILSLDRGDRFKRFLLEGLLKGSNSIQKNFLTHSLHKTHHVVEVMGAGKGKPQELVGFK